MPSPVRRPFPWMRVYLFSRLPNQGEGSRLSALSGEFSPSGGHGLSSRSTNSISMTHFSTCPYSCTPKRDKRGCQIFRKRLLSAHYILFRIVRGSIPLLSLSLVAASISEIARLNPVIRGWSHYYKHAHVPASRNSPPKLPWRFDRTGGCTRTVPTCLGSPG